MCAAFTQREVDDISSGERVTRIHRAALGLGPMPQVTKLLRSLLESVSEQERHAYLLSLSGQKLSLP